MHDPKTTGPAVGDTIDVWCSHCANRLIGDGKVIAVEGEAYTVESLGLDGTTVYRARVRIAAEDFQRSDDGGGTACINEDDWIDSVAEVANAASTQNAGARGD